MGRMDGVGFGARIGGTLRVPGRGLRRAVAVLVVLVLAAGLGGAVSLTAPGLLQRVGFDASPPAQLPAPAVPVLGPLAGGTAPPGEAGLDAVLAPLADSEALGDFAGVVLDPASGAVLWDDDPGASLVPGSTVKLLTAAAALLSLDPTEPLVTRVLAGREPGTVVLVGGGDPTLTALPAGQEGGYPSPTRLTVLADQVRDAVPDGVQRVVVDVSRYTGDPLAPGWAPSDVTDGFVAPIVPLMLDGGRVDPAEPDGARLADPAMAAGVAFAELLGVEDARVSEGSATADAQLLGSVGSVPVPVLVEHAIRSSDNVLAEVLAREVAISRQGQPSFAGATQEVVATLEQAGFDLSGTALLDGSGLSARNRVSVAVLGEVLAAAAAPADGGTEFLRPLISGLPVAGGDGTLDDRFDGDGDTAPGRGVVRAKTGTLTGVSSLAGIVTDAQDRLLVFALVSNDAPPPVARPVLDAIAAELSRCGCP